MRDEKFFTHPKLEWQRRYEALRALFVERLPHKAVANKFGYSPGYVLLLRHQFVHGKIDLAEPVPESKIQRRRVSAETRGKIVEWRKKMLSSGQITELLSEDGVEISVRTVERVIAEEGFSKLARRTRIKSGMTVKGAQIPECSEIVSLANLDGQRLSSDTAGVFLFAPLLCQFDIAGIANSAGLPGSKIIPAVNYLLSFIALKLIGTERYFGEESVLEKHWAGARGKRMKGALTLFAQDSQSKLSLPKNSADSKTATHLSSIGILYVARGPSYFDTTKG